MNDHKNWKGQNIPRVHKEWDGSTFAILPVLEFLLEHDEDSLTDLLPSEDSYGWEDDLANTWAWANNAYKEVYLIPDFSRFGCLPNWFPNKDMNDQPLTPQAQVDRFLYLLDYAYGGLPDDHSEVNPRVFAEAIQELIDDMGHYTSIEEEDGMEWEKAG